MSVEHALNFFDLSQRVEGRDCVSYVDDLAYDVASRSGGGMIAELLLEGIDEFAESGNTREYQ